MSIRIGIFGYGNLGRGVESAITQNEDMELVAVFTRRAPDTLKLHSAGVPVVSASDVGAWRDKIDVMIICGGSATDLPTQTPAIASLFNCIDSFDTHAKIPEYFKELDAVAKESNKLSLISVGWDPGLFSMARMLFGAFLPDGNDYTFWGKGVSQGHSDAIRRIDGVAGAIQYTIPKDDALDLVRDGKNPSLTARQKHLRECFVALKDGADKDYVEKTIKEMPNYFADYDTVVHFISMEELKENHSKLPHGGFVLRSGNTDKENAHLLELSLKLDSNPQFTGSVLVAYARAISKMAKEGKVGAVTVLDVPLGYLSNKTQEELRATLV